MTNNIFVGNLSFKATKEEVRKLFEEYGTVVGVAIVEKKKGKPRGFAFVDMPDENQKNAAIAGLQGKEFLGRPLIVSVLIPKAPKPAGYLKSKKSYEDAREDRNSKPYGKSQGDYKSYKQDDSRSRSYEKPRGEYKPYNKDGRNSKPYGKPQGDYKSYNKDDRSSKAYEKPRGEYKPYNKEDRNSKPYGKSQGEHKPYSGANDSRPWGKSKRASQGSAAYDERKRTDDGPKKTYGKSSTGSSKAFGKFYGKSSKPNLQSGYGTKSWPKKI